MRLIDSKSKQNINIISSAVVTMATIVEGYSEAHLNFWHLSFFNMTFWDYFEKMYKQIKSIYFGDCCIL